MNSETRIIALVLAISCCSYQVARAAGAVEAEHLASGDKLGSSCGFISSQATLAGLSDSSGVTVAVDGTKLSTQTAVDGSYRIACVPPGNYSLTFSKPPFGEVMPNVMVLPGVNAFIVDGALYPIPAIEIPRGRRVYTTSTSGGAFTPFIRGVSWDESTALINTDADRLRYVANLKSVRLDTGETTLLAERVSYVLVDEPRFSPDRRRVLFRSQLDSGYDSPGTLTMASLVDGRVNVLGTDVPPGFTLSPDGEHVLFVANIRSSSQLQYGPTEDGGVLTLAEDVSTKLLLFTPDGNRVLFLAGPSSASTLTLKVSELSGAPPVVIGTRVPADASVVLSGDGTQVAFLGNYGTSGPAADLTVVNLQTGATAQLRTLNYGFFCSILPRYSFSPDGTRTVSFGSEPGGGCNLKVNSVDGGSVFDLGMSSGGWIFSPDGTQVLFQAFLPDVPFPHSSLRIAALSDGIARTLVLDGVSGRDFVFWPDGQSISLIASSARETDALYSFRLADGATTRLGERAFRRPDGPLTFIRDGRLALYLLSPPSSSYFDLHKAPQDGEGEPLLAQIASDFQVHQNESLVVAITNLGNLLTIRIDDGHRDQIASDATFVAVSPDERVLAFNQHSASTQFESLVTAPINGGAQTVLIRSFRGEGQGSPFFPQWTGRGDLLAVKDGARAPLHFQDGLYVLNTDALQR